jgi:hypothetical protein
VLTGPILQCHLLLRTVSSANYRNNFSFCQSGLFAAKMRSAVAFNAAVALGFIGQSVALAISTPSQEPGSFAADSEAGYIAVRQIGHPLPPPPCDAQAATMINQKQTALSAALGLTTEAMETISECGGYR